MRGERNDDVAEDTRRSARRQTLNVELLHLGRRAPVLSLSLLDKGRQQLERPATGPKLAQDQRSRALPQRGRVVGVFQTKTVFLNGAIVVPDLTFENPVSNREIWHEDSFPEFIDYVKSYRSGDVRYVNWYDTE